jgi:REP element-mobilizing transposase RayT
MNLEVGKVYHIYNRGINKQTVFHSPENYIYFLKKVRLSLMPVCNILCYTLMPNHFHFLIETTEKSVALKKSGILEIQAVSYAIQQIQSSYTKAINKQINRTGSLFTQNVKCKCLNESNVANYGTTCFHYIHQNPWIAGLVQKIEDWEFSSFRHFAKFRNGTLINKERAFYLMELNDEIFYKKSYEMIHSNKIKLIK